MRIALVAHTGSPFTPATDSAAGARAARVAQLATAMARLGHRVTVYARVDAPGLPGSAILAPGATCEHIPAGPATPLDDDDSALAGCVREFADRLATRWRRARPDVAHAHAWTSGLAALAAAREVPVPVVQSFGLLGADGRPGRRGGETRARMEACLARSAAAVLAASAAEVTSLARLGVPRGELRAVPPGVDTSSFSPDGKAAKRPARPRLLARPLTSAHGLEPAVAALSGVPGAELVIIGGSWHDGRDGQRSRRGLDQLARQFGVADRVSVTSPPKPAGLPALYRSADLLLSTAPAETAGTAELEAMACGTPVIAYAPAGGCLDAVIDGVTGVLVPAGRLPLLTRAIRRLLADPVRLEAYAMASVDRARSRYSWDRVARETLASYTRCLAPASLATDGSEPATPTAAELARLAPREHLAAARA